MCDKCHSINCNCCPQAESRTTIITKIVKEGVQSIVAGDNIQVDREDGLDLGTANPNSGDVTQESWEITT